uniref:restriction endonuclease subunit S n=1 Tax=Wenzhouxiangella sp. EGI_FJ10305 TaxID=3243768 RepID=UPI0035D81875
MGKLTTGITPPSEDLDNYTEEGWPWITPDDLDDSGNSCQATKFLSDQGWSYCRRVASRSTLVCCIGSIGKLGYTDTVACTNQQITAVQPFLVPRYLFYFLYTAKPELDLRATGNVLRILNAERLGNIPAIMPPPDEAKVIGKFLDHQTARIDALIEEQQRLIKLLKEKRQAVISHAVTKGLDPEAPMKDSGVDWLGEVPADWDVVPIGLLASKIQTGPFGSQLHSHEYVQRQIPVINPANIEDGKIVPDSEVTVPEEIAHRLSHHRLQQGDLVLGRRGELGRCAVVGTKETGWLCGTGSMRIRFSERVDPSFLSELIRTPLVRDLLNLESIGSTMQSINPEIVAGVRVPVPPLEEQTSIVHSSLQWAEQVDRLLEQARHGIDLLHERRSALISAAVTGKIDVRNWQSETDAAEPLPIAAEESASYEAREQ